jgi:hypothetical protein
MKQNEVDLNDPLHWFIADSVDEFEVRQAGQDSGRVVSSEVLREMGQILVDAISCLESTGHGEQARLFRQRIRNLTARQ